jgi:DNA repair and recombination protein RAD52
VLGNCLYDKDYISKVAKVKSTPAKWDVEKLHRHPSCVLEQKHIPRSERLVANDPDPRRRRTVQSAISAEVDEDEFGGNAFDELDFVHPDEVCLLESNSPVKQQSKVDSAPRRDRSRTPVRGQGYNHASHPHAQQGGRGRSAPPIPMESATVLAPHRLPQPGAENVQNGNGGKLPTPPPTGFVNSRAAEILNTENRGPQLPAVPAFNPHVSGNIPRTKGIDHSKSTPISRQVVTKNANGGANGGNNAQPPRMNFVNPQADANRKIGMPMSGVPSPLSNRSAYKPPGPAGVKRTSEGPPRPPLADVSNVQLGGAGDADSKRQRFDGATENNAPAENKTNG